MAAPKKPVPQPPPPNLKEAWGPVPMDDPLEGSRLATMLPRISNREAFQRDLYRFSLILNAELYERERSNAKAVRSALEDLNEKLASALATLRNLGYDASAALHLRAKMQDARPRGDKGETIWQWLEVASTRPSGGDRALWVERALTDATRWAAEAAVGTYIPRIIVDPPDPNDPSSQPTRRGSGKPSDHITRNAVRGLADIWEEQTGSKPTIITDSNTGKGYGDFLDFCKAVLVPIYDLRSVKRPSFEAMVRSVLYPRKAAGED